MIPLGILALIASGLILFEAFLGMLRGKKRGDIVVSVYISIATCCLGVLALMPDPESALGITLVAISISASVIGGGYAIRYKKAQTIGESSE